MTGLHAVAKVSLFRPLGILGLVATIDVSIWSGFDPCRGRATKTEALMVKALQN